jgi:hypothetical protein
MHQEPDIMGAFYERVRRHVREGLDQYRTELRAVSNEMASRGLAQSGAHLVRRVEVLRKWTQAVTDQCFDDVTRLPGTQHMHRMVHADFLAEQLHEFFRHADREILFMEFNPAVSAEIGKRIVPIREGLDHDLRDFQAGLWRPRSRGEIPAVTNNTVNIHGSNVGLVQQAGSRAEQSAHVHFNAGAVQAALEEFVIALQDSNVADQIKSAAMIEVDSIRPQLKKSAPNVSIVHEGLHSLRNILEGVAAGLISTKLVALLSAAGMLIQ